MGLGVGVRVGDGVADGVSGCNKVGRVLGMGLIPPHPASAKTAAADRTRVMMDICVSSAGRMTARYLVREG